MICDLDICIQTGTFYSFQSFSDVSCCLRFMCSRLPWSRQTCKTAVYSQCRRIRPIKFILLFSYRGLRSTEAKEQTNFTVTFGGYFCNVTLIIYLHKLFVPTKPRVWWRGHYTHGYYPTPLPQTIFFFQCFLVSCSHFSPLWEKQSRTVNISSCGFSVGSIKNNANTGIMTDC